MKLSILICTLPDRIISFGNLIENLNQQISRLDLDHHEVEILFDDTPRHMTTGEKRNRLLQRATGKYTVFIDDDDEVPEYYVEECLIAAESDTDCFAINGRMTTNGEQLMKWKIYLGASYELKDGIYHRFPNHITPIKREHAITVPFQHITRQEDYNWACALRDTGLLKTEYVIEKEMYHYKFKTT